jgi:hypothetical protein
MLTVWGGGGGKQLSTIFSYISIYNIFYSIRKHKNVYKYNNV